MSEKFKLNSKDNAKNTTYVCGACHKQVSKLTCKLGDLEICEACELDFDENMLKTIERNRKHEDLVDKGGPRGEEGEDPNSN